MCSTASIIERKSEQRRETYIQSYLFFLTCCLHVVVPSQVYALVGSEQKGQVLGGMVAAGAGKLISSNLLLAVFHTVSLVNLKDYAFLCRVSFLRDVQCK